LRALEELQKTVSPGNGADSLANTGPKSRPLHVVTLTPFYPSLEDSVRGCFVAESLRQMELCGVRSSVIAVENIYHPRRQADVRAPAQWVRYAQIPGNLGLSTAGGFLGVRLLSHVRSLHAKLPIDVIHAHAALPCGHAASFLSTRLGIPFVVTVHGLDVFNSCFESGSAAGWRRNASLRVYERARNVICISEKVEQRISNGAGASVSTAVVYNGTDVEFFASGSAPEEPATILIVGNVLRGKGHELVLRALARLQPMHPNLQCRIIGEGADRQRFEILARDLGIAERVHFLGRRDRAGVAAEMRACTTFVLPSRFEGLGCVYLEAMACGKPVIGCRGQGIDEIIEHGVNGWLIPVDGLAELEQGLNILLSDAGRRRKIGEAARNTIVTRFTLSHQAANLIEIYRRAVR